MNRNLIVASFAALTAVFAFAASPASAKETPKAGSCCAMACCKPGASCCVPGASCCGASCCGKGCCATKAKAKTAKSVKAKAATKSTYAKVMPRS